MEYRRYGTFHLSDYRGSWFAIAVYLALAIGNYILSEISIFYIAILIIYAVIRLWSIISPNCERFSIDGSVITARKGKRVEKITIPAEITLVISHADISPPLSVRTPHGNKTHILKDKYAISILSETRIESILKRLHESSVKKYTTSLIELIFGFQFVYSFVCDEELLVSMMQNRECFIIIPECFVDQIPIIKQASNVYIDSEC